MIFLFERNIDLKQIEVMLWENNMFFKKSNFKGYIL